jgi:hypothetical protein
LTNYAITYIIIIRLRKQINGDEIISIDIRAGRKLRCSECGAVFEPWDDVYTWENGRETELVCEECFDNSFDALSRQERADLVGSRVASAEELLEK